MKKFKELTSEIEEAVIKRLDLAKLRKRSREQSIIFIFFINNFLNFLICEFVKIGLFKT